MAVEPVADSGRYPGVERGGGAHVDTTGALVKATGALVDATGVLVLDPAPDDVGMTSCTPSRPRSEERPL